MVLAPVVLVALAVMVEEMRSLFGDVQIFGRCGEKLGGLAAFHRDLVEFTDATVRDIHRGGGVLTSGSENDAGAISRESPGDVVI
ncbi:hypothetical protein N9F58_00925 [Akkermansiaceae bacterium]|nr:hypothetical protein [Akkermansiaceae bacterium]